METSFDKLKTFESALSLHGLELPEEIAVHIQAELDGEEPKIGNKPVTHIILALSDGIWVERLRADTLFAEFVAIWICHLHATVSQYRDLVKERRTDAYSRLSLASRRLILMVSANQKYRDREKRAALLTGEPELPNPSLVSPRLVNKPASKDAMRSFLNEVMKIEQRIGPTLLIQRDDSDLEPTDLDGATTRFSEDEVEVVFTQPRKVLYRADETYTGHVARKLAENSAVTKMNAYASCNKPVALRWLADTVADNEMEAMSADELRFTFCWLMELFHGLKAADSLYLGLDPHCTQLGKVSERAMVLKLNSGYFISAQCWKHDDLYLPLAPEAGRILGFLRARFPGATRVKHLREGKIGLMDRHRSLAARAIRKYLPNAKKSSIQIDRLWLQSALVALDLPAALVGLLRGHPVGGARGQSAYISATHRQIVDALHQVQEQIRREAGIPCQPFSEEFEVRDHKFGKHAISLRQFAKLTLDHIRGSQTSNEIIACVVRLCRGLGFRLSNQHINPWRFYRDEPLPLLEVRDKRAGEWLPPRYIPLSPSFMGLIRKLREVFGDQEYLTYDAGGKHIMFDELPGLLRAPLDDILRDNEQYNAGRTGAFNALIQRRAGDVIRQVVLGHGSLVTHLNGNHLPVTPLRILEAAQEVVFSICADEGLDECARELTEKLGVIQPASRILTNSRSIETETTKKIALARTPAGVQEPLRWEELLERRAIQEKLKQLSYPANYQPSESRHHRVDTWPSHGAGVLGLVGLTLGIPLKSLLRFQAYYTFESFIFDQESQSIFFQAIGRHHDAGGLFGIPIFVCRLEEENDNKLMQLVRYTFARAVARFEFVRKNANPEFLPNKKIIESVIMKQRLFGEESLKSTSNKIESNNTLPRKKARIAKDELVRPETKKTGVGDRLKFLLKVGDRCPYTAHQVFVRLDRMATTTCALRHSPLLAGCLSGRTLLGLNHFSVQDLFNTRNRAPSRLTGLTGEPWTERWDYPARKDSELTAALAKSGNNPRSFETWKHFFCPDGTRAPRWTTVHNTLCEYGLPPNKARGLASRLMQAFCAEGRFGFGKGLPLLSREDLAVAVKKAEEYLRGSYKPQVKENIPASANVTAESIQSELAWSINVLHQGLARPDELRSLEDGDVTTTSENGFVYIQGGKSVNARRVIDISRDAAMSLPAVRQPPTLDENPGGRLLKGLHLQHRNVGSTTDAFRDALRAGEGTRLTPYDLRHLGIIFAVQRAIDEKLIHGNFAHALAHHSVRVGHGALTVTLNTYVGTALFLFM